MMMHEWRYLLTDSLIVLLTGLLSIICKVTTLYDEDVWRRRHYRVRRGNVPGQFYFSVLDNGVTSNEFWRILDCADE